MTTYNYDSRKVSPGDIFLCLPGGEKYISDAKANGAVEIKSVTRGEMAHIAAKAFGYPSRQLKVIGITGTNGKTTTVKLIADVLTAAGYKPTVSGTINKPLTTPESLDIQADMSEWLKVSGTHYIMEVSSHGIDQGRVLAIEFTGKLLTNITQDHLDYHKTMESYTAVKMKFMREYSGWSIYPEDYASEKINFTPKLLGSFNQRNIQGVLSVSRKLGIDPQLTEQVLASAPAPKGRFEQVEAGQDFTVIVDYAHTPDGLLNVLQTAREILIENSRIPDSPPSPLSTFIERGNRSDIPPICECREGGLGGVSSGSGRNGVHLISDLYLHPNNQSLVTCHKPLATKETMGRLITLFGCGGDRDRGKRPQMGKLAMEWSDIVIITSDNPRTEDPSAIITEIKSGIHNVEDITVLTIIDRREAIAKAMEMAKPGDIVLLAGKGHEEYQIIGTEKQHFDDHEEAVSAIGKIFNF